MVNARLLLALLVAAPGLAAAAPAAAPAGPRVKVAVVPGIAVNLDSGARRCARPGSRRRRCRRSSTSMRSAGSRCAASCRPTACAPDCVTTPACIADVAKRTGAQQLLFVVMVDSGAAADPGRHDVGRAVDRQERRRARRSICRRRSTPTRRPSSPPPRPSSCPTRRSGQAEAGPASTSGIHGQASASPRATSRPPSLATAGRRGRRARRRHRVRPARRGRSTTRATDRTHERARRAQNDDDPHRRGTSPTSASGRHRRGRSPTAVLYATSGESPHVDRRADDAGGAAVTAFGRF